MPLLNNDKIYGKFIDGVAVIYKKRENGFQKGLLFEDGTEKYFPKCDFDNFSCGLAVFWSWEKTETERMSYINRKGELLFEPKNIAASEFSEDRAFIYDIDKNITVLINTTGNVVKEFDEIYDTGLFSDGVASVRLFEDKREAMAEIVKEGHIISKIHEAFPRHTIKVGYVNRNGEFVVPLGYEYAPRDEMDAFNIDSDCYEGMILVRSGDKFGFITKENILAVPCVYDFGYHFHNGMAAVEINKKIGFIDKHNNIILPFEYESFGWSKDGIIGLKKNNVYGFLDEQRNEMLPFEYEEVNCFSEGIAAVKKNGKWGAIDRRGNIILPFEFNYLTGFHDGLIEFRRNDKLGLMNREGKVIIPEGYLQIDYFEEGICKLWQRTSKSDADIVALADREGNLLRLDL
ncbi:MAG: WG repeat-containing protein [Ignavibacteriales bacterium]|nr:WG repeat-containing protein [Ignavibacteriales bacterium]